MINMGVPALIGVCQQSTGGGGSSFSITSFTTVTVSFGTNTGNQQTIAAGVAVTTVLDSSNSFSVPASGLRSFFDEENAGIPVQHSFTPVINGSNIAASDLPTDGNCIVRYSFSFDPTSFPLKIYDNANEEIMTTSPTEIIFENLNRSTFTSASSTLPTVDLSAASQFKALIAPNPGEIANTPPEITAEVKILKGDGSYLTQTQAINFQDKNAIAPFVVGG